MQLRQEHVLYLPKQGLTSGTMTIQATSAGLTSNSIVVTIKPSVLDTLSDAGTRYSSPKLVLSKSAQWFKVAGDHFKPSVVKNKTYNSGYIQCCGKKNFVQ